MFRSQSSTFSIIFPFVILKDSKNFSGRLRAQSFFPYTDSDGIGEMTFLQAVLSASFEADQNEEDAYNKGSMYNIDLLVMDGAN